MPAQEYKVLAPFNLPYVDKRYAPGATVAYSDIQKYADEAAKANPDGHTPTAAETVKHFTDTGVLSSDKDAQLHPDHVPVDPNEPTVASLMAQAQFLSDKLKEQGRPVPDELKAMAKAAADYRHVTASDAGSGGDKGA